MSLYGALFVGVSGLKAQGTKIGIISDNIANVNTVGYKQTKAAFETLVVNQGQKVAYYPGGVIANNVQLVDQQGILTATDAPTDIAISGSGFFAVSAKVDGTGEPLYTRAGSFRKDNVGNYQNSNGFYLKGWPLDRDGKLPGEVGNANTISSSNLDSLEVVNLKSQSGLAAGTTKVTVKANLNAAQPVHLGSGVTIGMDVTSNNYKISADDIIVPFAGTIKTDEFTVATGGGLTYTYEYGGFSYGRNVTSGAGGESITAPSPNVGIGGFILDASSPTDAFLKTTGTAGFTATDLTFTITTGNGGTKTFTYQPSSPNASSGQFSNLNNLATAIDGTAGLTARVVGGQLYVGPEDANDSISFANGGTGIDWKNEIGLLDQGVGTNRFNSMNSLAAMVNASTGMKAIVNFPQADSTLQIHVADPLDTVAFYDGADTNIATTTNTGSLIDAFGLTGHPNYVAGATENSITAINPAYDTAGVIGKNMASGDIVADFSRNVTIYDSLGDSHELRLSYLKSATNTWQVEVHAIPATDVNTTLVDGQVATGTLIFNGDGTLNSVSSSLLQPLNITWNNGATASQISLEWGTAGPVGGTAGAPIVGKADGMTQFKSASEVKLIEQNGAPVGELVGVTIDKEGYVIASYTNGETQKLYKLPIADFTNPNGLRSITGNVFSETNLSGEVNLREAGKSGVGTVVASALEASNVELATELTDMIVAQRAYQANSKVISTSDELLDTLTRL